MAPLSSDLRGVLERGVITARDVAEESSNTALRALGVDVDRLPEHLGEADRRLRIALRAAARQLGGFERLVEECAYEQWHRMLFARFLADNELLIHPDHGISVSLAECKEIARERRIADPWLVAAEFASAMLPGIFWPDDPVLRVRLAPEGQQALEELLTGLPRDVFTSDDGLGWVYQYWQTKQKNEVNRSERKIGGADLPAVTQLFTEHYMVQFLLENTLGGWWAARHPDSPLVKEWVYLRVNDDGTPAAGSFPGWPETVAGVTVMDPCCGSGHFLVTAFEMLRRMRMEIDGLTASGAGDAVLRDNLFGLELDARCTQIAAFALALQAWKTGGFRDLPVPNIACSGISAAGRLDDWRKLAGGDEQLERSLERLHALFAEAADLGSLIDPLRETDGDLLAAQFESVQPLLQAALRREAQADPAATVFGTAATGAAKAALLLARRYTLVGTNVPYLHQNSHERVLKKFSQRRHTDAKADLATLMMSRWVDGLTNGGIFAGVTPQNWLTLGSYRHLRSRLLAELRWGVLVRLGPGAFRAVSGEVVQPVLFIASRVAPSDDHRFSSLDVSPSSGAREKDLAIQRSPLTVLKQKDQASNPDSRIVLEKTSASSLLSEVGGGYSGIQSGDYARFGRVFWEQNAIDTDWSFQQSTVTETTPYGGREHIFYWENGSGVFLRSVQERLGENRVGAWIRGKEAWGKRGVVVSQTGDLKVTLYQGELFDNNAATVIPKQEADLPAIWAFLTSPEYSRSVRLIDQTLKVTNVTLVKVPFDVEHWRAVAEEIYPRGLPHPQSPDPTQWLFDGRPDRSRNPVQVSVARLVGYRWPRQTGSEFLDCPALGEDGLEPFADEDGIVCIPAVRGEQAAVDRLRSLLAAAFAEEWSPAREADLLAGIGYARKSLEQWLRDGFFDHHCQLFHQRPFVWQVWDGRKDGFSALVNYHRLDRPMLERLTYTYLGDWIRQQRAGIGADVAGSEPRLVAAEELQRKLQLIVDGESPYDVFVRWKSIEEQPLGWEPDLNDGVRMNIRPFVTAGVLRKNPRVNWNKDRGKDAESAPWYPAFKGDRINGHHLTLDEKRAAREVAAAPTT